MSVYISPALIFFLPQSEKERAPRAPLVYSLGVMLYLSMTDPNSRDEFVRVERALANVSPHVQAVIDTAQEEEKLVQTKGKIADCTGIFCRELKRCMNLTAPIHLVYRITRTIRVSEEEHDMLVLLFDDVLIAEQRYNAVVAACCLAALDRQWCIYTSNKSSIHRALQYQCVECRRDVVSVDVIDRRILAKMLSASTVIRAAYFCAIEAPTTQSASDPDRC